MFGEFLLLATAFVAVIAALKGQDEREYRRDRERRGIREDD
jgi:hypothetical protein